LSDPAKKPRTETPQEPLRLGILQTQPIRRTSLLPARLTLRNAFLFPVQTPDGRRDIWIGGLLILSLWPIGWVLNLGNRLNVVSRLYRGEVPTFTGFRPLAYTFRRGCISFATISAYLAPSVITGALAVYLKLHGVEGVHYVFAVLSAILFVLGVFTLPGCMTVYAVGRDSRVLRNPVRAFRRAWGHRGIYGRAWAISLASVLASLLGLLALGIGFIFTSVWSWEVVGYAFTVALYREDSQG
jgi:hypothetical protein